MSEKKNTYGLRLSRRNLCFGAMLGALIGIIAFAPIWIQNNGQYMDYGDYFLQYIPFIEELKRMLVSGNFSWSWNSFLGDGFVGAYSYYTVFNPFAWFLVLFPGKYILYATMFATIAKLSISMIGSMLFMRRFCKSDTYALIGALLYTFSGFTLVNTCFYFFLDVIALFPFLMYGIEVLIFEKKPSIYVIFLMINAAINYYFFVSTVVLIIIYVFFRLELYHVSQWKNQTKTLCHIIVYSILGTGLAGFALFPSFYAILGSKKATESIGTGIALLYYPQNILEHIRTLVAPIESARYHAFFDSSTWSSTGAYLPVFGCTCAIWWCIQKKDWLTNICIALTICFFVPSLNAVFNLFSSIYYTRWLYGYVLIISLMTVRTLEEMEQKKQVISKKLLTGITILTSGLLFIPTIIYFLHRSGISVINRFASACQSEFFMGYSALVIMLVLTVINLIALWFSVGTKKTNAARIISVIIMISALNFCVFNAINYDLHAAQYSTQYYYEKTMIEGSDAPVDSPFEYRIDYPWQVTNYGLFKNRPAVNYYNSLQNPSSTRFAVAVGIADSLKDVILTAPAEGEAPIDALLSVKYYYDYDGNTSIPEGFRYLRTENHVDIYENTNYIPMGFVYDSYCPEERLAGLLPEERAAALLQALVISEQDEAVARKYLPLRGDGAEDLTLSEAASRRRETTCSYFKGTHSGFDATITLETNNIVFFSIPNDKGWEITVNGKPASVVDVNYGLMGICCEAGENTISAVYHTRGWTVGVVCSLSCLAALAFVAFIGRKRCQKLG